MSAIQLPIFFFSIISGMRSWIFATDSFGLVVIIIDSVSTPSDELSDPSVKVIFDQYQSSPIKVRVILKGNILYTYEKRK